jgi:hypothetical protein
VYMRVSIILLAASGKQTAKRNCEILKSVVDDAGALNSITPLGAGFPSVSETKSLAVICPLVSITAAEKKILLWLPNGMALRKNNCFLGGLSS